MRLLVLAAGLCLLATPCRADVIHLKNGRTLEGRVIERTERQVRLKTADGVVVLPTAVIEGITKQDTPEEELARRAAAVDMNDPAAIEALALWASSRGLGDQSCDLMALARGIRLERMVARAKELDDPAEFVSVFHWARTNEVSDEVLDWLLAEAARRAEPGDPSVAQAHRLRADDLARRARDQARREELLRRPRYVDPEQQRRFQAALAADVTARRPPRGDARRGAELLERARTAAGSASSPTPSSSASSSASSSPPPSSSSDARPSSPAATSSSR